MRGIVRLCLVGLLALQGCAVFAVGAVTGPAAGIPYTSLGVAEKTFPEEREKVLTALNKALATLDVKTGQITNREEGGRIVQTDLQAYARDLDITISLDQVSERAARVSVDATRNHIFKDKATATEILVQTAANLPPRP